MMDWRENGRRLFERLKGERMAPGVIGRPTPEDERCRLSAMNRHAQWPEYG